MALLTALRKQLREMAPHRLLQHYNKQHPDCEVDVFLLWVKK
jgi:hypothetical protein